MEMDPVFLLVQA